MTENEVALIAARGEGTQVTMEHFEVAIDRIIGGLEKRNNGRAWCSRPKQTSQNTERERERESRFMKKMDAYYSATIH